MKSAAQTLGQRGEDEACAYLSGKNYRVVGRNIRMGRGEIDVIAIDPEFDGIVFVEIKSGTSSFHPMLHFNKKKAAQVRSLASMYLARKYSRLNARIDLITVDYQTNRPVIEHFKNVF